MTSHPTTGYVPPKRDFIGKPAPPGYVAGIGRGATGFTTRSDIGPAREAASVRPDDDGTGPSTSGAKPKNQIVKRSADDDEEEVDLNESNYDEFAGYGGSLFNRDPYEPDDEEADKIYASVEKHIDERGKALRESRARQEREALRQKRPKIQHHFIDLKEDLKKVKEEEWANIPEVGDARNRKQRIARQDKFTPVPDSLLAHQAKLAAGGDKLVYIDPNAAQNSDNESDKDSQDDQLIDRKPILPLDGGQGLNIGEMSDFRSSYMSMKLSRVSNQSTSQASSTDPRDYLKNLQTMVPNQITNTAQVNEFRKLFASLRKSKITEPYFWIISVNLEEAAGKLKAARALALEACDKIPKKDSLWLEAIRLHPPDIAKPLVVEALKKIPRSVKLWIKAAELESDDESRRRVYTKARELSPRSVLLWKKSVELEKPDQARVLLKQAVECCPDAVELWVALSRLLPYEEATQTLKEANEKNPRDRTVWLTAAKLQEQVGKLDACEQIVKLSVSDLAEKGVEIKRSEWLREAVDADRAGFKHTCREIIKRIIGWNIPEEARLKQWPKDAQEFIANGSIDCARAVFMAMVEEKSFCKFEAVWQEYANFELKHGNKESLIACLQQAVQAQHCAKSESIWLMLANQTRDNLDECRRTLERALSANPGSERIVVAAVELESENGNSMVARRILANACASSKTPQLVMRAAKLEWSLGNLDEAQRKLIDGVREYKNYAEFYLCLGQIEQQRGNIDKAKSWYSQGLKFNPTCVEIWISMAKLEERSGCIAKARSRLEMARLRNPKNVELWLESAQLEWRQYQAKAGSAGGAPRTRPDMVITILAKGIRECKDNPDVEKLNKMQTDVRAKRFG